MKHKLHYQPLSINYLKNKSILDDLKTYHLKFGCISISFVMRKYKLTFKKAKELFTLYNSEYAK